MAQTHVASGGYTVKVSRRGGHPSLHLLLQGSCLVHYGLSYGLLGVEPAVGGSPEGFEGTAHAV